MVDVNTLLEHEDLFMTEFPDGIRFYWRLLSLREYYLFTTLISGNPYAFDIYMQVFKQAVLIEHQLINTRLPMGYFVSVAKAIMFLSGDGAQDNLVLEIDMARKLYPANGIDEIMKSHIYTAFPHYKPSDLLAMSRAKLIRLFAQAEGVLANRIQGFKPIDFTQIKYESDKVADEEPISINFEQDEALQRQQLHPWELYEDPSQSPQAISRTVAKRLDARKSAK